MEMVKEENKVQGSEGGRAGKPTVCEHDSDSAVNAEFAAEVRETEEVMTHSLQHLSDRSCKCDSKRQRGGKGTHGPYMGIPVKRLKEVEESQERMRTTVLGLIYLVERLGNRLTALVNGERDSAVDEGEITGGTAGHEGVEREVASGGTHKGPIRVRVHGVACSEGPRRDDLNR